MWFLESLDAVHRAIQGSKDLGEALNAALAVLLEVFACDRSWLVDARGEAWIPVMERTRPEYPGGLRLGVEQPYTALTASEHARALDSDWCVQLDPEEAESITIPADVPPPRAVLAMAIYPKVGSAWILGLHQCSYVRTWGPEEERLFVEIGHRLADALTGLLAYREVRESEQKLAQAQRVARLGYWERDVTTFEVSYSEQTYRIFGLSPELHTLEPAKLADRLHPDDRHIMLAAYEQAVAGGPRYDVDYRVLRPDGEVRYVHSEADVTWDADGRAIRLFGTMQDITERKQTEQQLVRYRDALQDLAREQEALRRVATLVARATSPEEIFASVTEEAGRLLAVDLAALGRHDTHGETVVAGWSANGSLDGIGRAMRLGGDNIATMVYRTGRPARMDNYDLATGEVAAVRLGWGVRALVGAPITVDGDIRGVMYAGSTTERPLPHDAEDRLASFTELLGTAYANAEAREALRRVADEQAALRRVATLVARGDAPEAVFAAVAEEAGRLVSADIAMIGRYGVGPSVTAIVAWRRDGNPNPAPLGVDVPLGGENIMSRVFSTGQPVRIESHAKTSGELADLGRASGEGSAVGVPITVEGRVWGVMVTSLQDELPWPPDTEERLLNFTELAATAIANADAREELRHVADEQAALRRVATLVARGVAPELVFGAVAEEVGRLLPAADIALVGRYRSDRSFEFVGGWSRAGEAEWVGKRAEIGGHNVTTAVFESKQPARVDHLDDDGTAVTVIARSAGARSSAGAPINVEGRPWGVVTVGSVHEAGLPPGIERKLAGFTELVATAIANSEAREQLVASRARVVAAADEARRRIERDLHDGVQQRLVVLGLELQSAREMTHDLPPLRKQLSQFGQGLTSVLDDLREISSGLHPAILRHGGLRTAIRELARRSPVPVELDVQPDLRLSEHVEVAAYYIVSEALTNTAKHARASSVEIRIRLQETQLELSIRDDGTGGATPGAGSGLIGLTDRVEALGGRIQIVSPAGEGTALDVRLPLTTVLVPPALGAA